MNYSHSYHAGNFADVFKHCILAMLMQYLSKKDQQILYLDTHAGLPSYDLFSELAQKTQEYANGIARIYAGQNCPATIRAYLNIVKQYNPTTALQFYPGSANIIYALLRPQDKMILVELHEENAHQLKREFRQDKRVAVHQADGYQSIKAFLPPKQGRGLILLDPPFEEKNEFAQIVQAMQIAFQRFPIGIYAIWYPCKDLNAVQSFYRELKQLGFKDVITAEITIATKSQMLGLTSCGMAIVNPPWNFAQQLQELVSWLCSVLAIK